MLVQKNLSLFVKYSIYGPHKTVKYSIYGPKNIFRVGNIIHRVERKRSLWIWTTRKYFLLIKAFSYQMSRYGFFCCTGHNPHPWWYLFGTFDRGP